MNSSVEPQEVETKHKWQPAPNPGVPALTKHALFTGVSVSQQQEQHLTCCRFSAQ